LMKMKMKKGYGLQAEGCGSIPSSICQLLSMNLVESRRWKAGGIKMKTMTRRGGRN